MLMKQGCSLKTHFGPWESSFLLNSQRCFISYILLTLVCGTEGKRLRKFQMDQWRRASSCTGCTLCVSCLSEVLLCLRASYLLTSRLIFENMFRVPLEKTYFETSFALNPIKHENTYLLSLSVGFCFFFLSFFLFLPLLVLQMAWASITVIRLP